jgi:hypothetical protein
VKTTHDENFRTMNCSNGCTRMDMDMQNIEYKNDHAVVALMYAT